MRMTYIRFETHLICMITQQPPSQCALSAFVPVPVLLKPNSITLAGSKLVRSWSQTGSKPNSITLSDSNHLLTSSEPTSVMEFGFYCATPCAVYAVVVCLCLSQVGVLVKRLKVGSRQRTPHDSPRTLSFPTLKISAKLKRGHPNGGAKCRWSRITLATFDK